MPGNDLWANLPNVWHNGAQAKLDGNWIDNQYHENALPCLWEFSLKYKERRCGVPCAIVEVT